MSRYINADLSDTALLYAVQKLTYDADTFITVRKILNKLPTADVVPVVHAHWVIDRYCSHCDCDIYDYDIYSKIPKYCPECGAKMDEKLGV